MTKKELREQYFKLCRRALKIDKDPDWVQVITCTNIFAQVIDHPDAERELGTEVCNLIKRCTKRHRNDTEVMASKLMEEIDFFQKEEQ